MVALVVAAVESPLPLLVTEVLQHPSVVGNTQLLALATAAGKQLEPLPPASSLAATVVDVQTVATPAGPTETVEQSLHALVLNGQITQH